MKNPLFLLCLFLLIGCKSLDRVKPFTTILDSDSVTKRTPGFSIEIPEDWVSYIGVHSELWHTPKELKKGKMIARLNHFTVNVFDNKKDINVFSFDKIKRLKRIYRGSKISKKGYKNKYGNYLIFKYGFVDLKNITHSVSEVVYFIEDKVYVFKYSSPNKDYDTYLPDVLKMIKSFKIEKNSNEN